jgi:hypothetical protein
MGYLWYNVGTEKAHAMLQTSVSVVESVTRLKENESNMDKPTISLFSAQPESLQRHILESKLDRSEKYVLLALSLYSANGVVSQSLQFLEFITNYTRHAIGKAIQSLIEREVLECVDARIFNGRQYAPTVYKIHPEKFEALPPYERSASYLANPIKTRKELVEKHNSTCAYCKKAGDDKFGPDGERWSIDRVVPRAHGGKYKTDNLVLACRSCNRKKHKNKS